MVDTNGGDLCGSGGGAAVGADVFSQIEASRADDLQYFALEAGGAGFAGQCAVAAVAKKPAAVIAVVGDFGNIGGVGAADFVFTGRSGAKVCDIDR